MENRVFLGLLIFFVLVQQALAYEKPTHTDLTSKTFDFFNKKFPKKKIPQEFLEDLIAGAVEEDEPPRWFFHFYDPVNNRGLTLKNMSFVSAKQWAQDKVGQGRLSRNFLASFFTGDEPVVYTWGQAIKAYKKGDQEKAFRILGHSLHLLQDMAVPEHVRNEYHPQGSPYEKFSARQRAEIEDWRQPVVLESLDDYFDELATYTNKNFYSPKTIPGDIRSFTGFDNEFGQYKMVVKDTDVSSGISITTINSPSVLSDYYRILSRKSILYGAGLINLFFQQAEKELVEGKKEIKPVATVAAIVKKDEAGLKERAVIPLDKAREKKTLPLPEAEEAPRKKPACSFNVLGGSARFPVIINELAWMGSLQSSSDEWIELRNISSASVSINGWSLVDKDADIEIVLPNATLPAGGFYLLERTDDQAVPQETADLIYKGALANENDGLRLFDHSCRLIDEVLAAPDWPAGSSRERRTLERSPDFSWHTYSGGSNAGIYGTPKRVNSAPPVRYSTTPSSAAPVAAPPSNSAQSDSPPPEPEPNQQSNPSFLSAINFFPHPLGGPALIDLQFSQYPIISGSTDTWKIVVFYLNALPNPDANEIITTQTNWLPSSGAFLNISYPIYSRDTILRPSLILPDTAAGSSNVGGIFNQAFNLTYIEDSRLRLEVPQAVSSGDYFTLAFYDFVSSGGGSHNFSLKAVDNRPQNFQETPPVFQPPVISGAVTATFFSETNQLRFNWSQATDPDSRDALLSYEVRINGGQWLATRAIDYQLTVTPGTTVNFEIKAKDEFNNYSEIKQGRYGP